jgi:hypothetical protein
MILRLFACALLLVLAVPALAADPLSYDDPAMHFQAPAGWERVDLGAAGSEDDAPVAVFAYHRGKSDVRTIAITIKQYDGSLNDLAGTRQSEMRQGGTESQAIFINKHEPFTLTNGMPAFEIFSTISSDSRTQLKNYEYLVVDGRRSIDVTLSGTAGDIDEKSATAALSSLYVVAFPARRP